MRWLPLAASLVAGCTSGGIPEGEQVPDFSLEDVNPASVTAGEPVSPRDRIGQTSAWYFGHAT